MSSALYAAYPGLSLARCKNYFLQVWSFKSLGHTMLSNWNLVLINYMWLITTAVYIFWENKTGIVQNINITHQRHFTLVYLFGITRLLQIWEWIKNHLYMLAVESRYSKKQLGGAPMQWSYVYQGKLFDTSTVCHKVFFIHRDIS